MVGLTGVDLDRLEGEGLANLGDFWSESRFNGLVDGGGMEDAATLVVWSVLVMARCWVQVEEDD